MKKIIFLALFCYSLFAWSQVKIENGTKLMVDGKPIVINGMNWDYFPIGTNYSYSIWSQPDNIIKQALDDEMGLLKNMGVNSIRVYSGIPKKWIEYIYNNYGIYTMLNHSFGRYGLTIGGTWEANTEYSDPETRDLLIKEVKDMAANYKDTKGLLLFLLGNENNYGLFWEGAETENIPIEDRKSTIRAQAMYKLFNDAALEMKNIDKSHPIAICNGDLLFLDLIAKECNDIDILGINVYRGASFGDLFSRVKDEFGKPVLLTEFGSDAFNAVTNEEDQNDQANYLKSNWEEIYGNVAGMGNADNCLGGFTFQFSDGWWKYEQTKNLTVHDTNASWANGGYKFDYIKGDNNMNEEWFGVCAKGPTDSNGLYELYPRAAYYILKDVHSFNPIGSSIASLQTHFTKIQLGEAALKARGDKAALEGKKASLISLSRLSAEFSTYNTGGHLITTPDTAPANNTTYPNQLGFDHMQSFYVGVEANPSANMRANVEFNILGNVALNPIDEIFYENRGRPITVKTLDGTEVIKDNNRIQLYKASYDWENKYFNLHGFYRTGHYHWGYEGDFFGLYREANYGPVIDTYNGNAPSGFEFEAKKALKGLKIAFGPELWWGANPAVLVKYSREIAKFNVTGIYHDDIAKQENVESSYAIPQPKTRRATLQVNRKIGKFGFDVGGIWAGQPLNGREYQVVRGNDDNQQVYKYYIEDKDNWGGKVKLTYAGGRFNWYGQASALGLVANGGYDQTQTFTGWRLKDTGVGNQYNVLSGFTYSFGNFQIAPNFLWQKPLEGPIPSTVAAPGRPRNILDDPFAVRINREQTAGELLLTYDPTPATWFNAWDNDEIEDAKFAFNAGFIFRHLPTIQDAAVGISADGRTPFAFSGSAPAKDLWEFHSRIVSKVNHNLGVIANLYAAEAQANGNSTRAIIRYGADVRVIYNKFKFNYVVKFNDWGPYDYHKDFNLTFPLQLMLDVSYHLGKPTWFILPSTSIGIRGTWRSLDQYSPRYSPTQMLDASGAWVPNPNAIGFPDGNEWEIRTYIKINIGK